MTLAVIQAAQPCAAASPGHLPSLIMRHFLPALLIAPLTCAAQAPTWEWVKAQQGTTSEIAADDAGNSYALISVFNEQELLGAPGSYSGGYLVKLDPAGQPLWTRQCDGCAIDRLVYARGALYASGEGWGEYTFGGWTEIQDTLSPTYFIAKLNLDGVTEWMFTAKSSNNIQTGDISINASDEVFIAGSGYGDVLVEGDTVLYQPGNALAYFWKLAPDGSFEWLRAGGCSISGKTRAKGAACDRSGSFYATGYTSADPEWCSNTPFGPLSIPIEAGFFLVKLRNDGAYEWVRWADNLYALDLECMNDSMLIVSGTAFDSVTFEGQAWFTTGSGNSGAFIGAFNMIGEPAWSVFSQGGYAHAYRLALDSSSIWTAVACVGPFQLGQGIQLDTANYTMILNVTPQGDPAWLARVSTDFGESCYIESTGFALGGDGTAYVSGYVLSQNQIGCSLDWQSGSFNIPPEVDSYWTYFIARLNSDEVIIADNARERGPRGYPNPCDDYLWLDVGSSHSATVRIFTADGRLVLVRNLSAGSGFVQTDNLCNGYYVLDVQFGGNRATLPVLVHH